MKRLSLIAVIVGAGLSASASDSTVEIVDQIAWGITLGELAEILPAADLSGLKPPSYTLLHHFTVTQDQTETCGVSGRIYGQTYYFVFRDDRLAQIVPLDIEGDPLAAARQTDPFSLVETLRLHPGVDLEDLRASWPQDRKAQAWAETRREPLWALAPFSRLPSRELDQRRRFGQLVRDLNGLNVAIGSHIDELDAKLGPRRFEVPADDQSLGRVDNRWRRVEGPADTGRAAVHGWTAG